MTLNNISARQICRRGKTYARNIFREQLITSKYIIFYYWNAQKPRSRFMPFGFVIQYRRAATVTICLAANWGLFLFLFFYLSTEVPSSNSRSLFSLLDFCVRPSSVRTEFLMRSLTSVWIAPSVGTVSRLYFTY